MYKPAKSLLLTLSTLMMLVPALAAQSARTSVSAAEVNGTLEMNFRGKFQRMSNEIKLLALGGNKLRFAMDLVYPYTLRNGETMVNMGGLDGQMSIVGDTAVYRSENEECNITLKFTRKGTLKVKQDGSDGKCGFGHNVFATGTYLKTSSRRPRFDD